MAKTVKGSSRNQGKPGIIVSGKARMKKPSLRINSGGYKSSTQKGSSGPSPKFVAG